MLKHDLDQKMERQNENKIYLWYPYKCDAQNKFLFIFQLYALEFLCIFMELLLTKVSNIFFQVAAGLENLRTTIVTVISSGLGWVETLKIIPRAYDWVQWFLSH